MVEKKVVEKKTVGQLVIDNWGKHPAPEAQEIAETYWAGELRPRLEKIIKEHKNYAKKIYILVNMGNHFALGENGKKTTILIGDVMFPPKSEAMQISYDYSTEHEEVVWAIPDCRSVEEILAIPETYDEKIVSDCKKYREYVQATEKEIKRRSFRSGLILPRKG